VPADDSSLRQWHVLVHACGLELIKCLYNFFVRTAADFHLNNIGRFAVTRSIGGTPGNWRLHTVFGWTVHVGPDANARSLRNFPCQANGAEMMRLACCLATEGGVNVVAPVHDALMIEGPADAIDEIVARTQEAMAEASAIVLDGFLLRSDASTVRWPDRKLDGRGRKFWGRVMGLIPCQTESLETDETGPFFDGSTVSAPSEPFTRLARC
jgi:hypothetical protein